MHGAGNTFSVTFFGRYQPAEHRPVAIRVMDTAAGQRLAHRSAKLGDKSGSALWVVGEMSSGHSQPAEGSVP
jgi:hypothetical protein